MTRKKHPGGKPVVRNKRVTRPSLGRAGLAVSATAAFAVIQLPAGATEPQPAPTTTSAPSTPTTSAPPTTTTAAPPPTITAAPSLPLPANGIGPEHGASGATLANLDLADPQSFTDVENTFTVASSLWLRAYTSCDNTSRFAAWVPLVSQNDNCVLQDALPAGPGDWAAEDWPVWAPSINIVGDQHYLYYSAKRKNSGPNAGQMCIGRAISASGSAAGPYKSGSEVACPPNNRWAIDPDVYTGPEGSVLTYRDDAIADPGQSGISSVPLDSNGFGIFSQGRTLLQSTDIPGNGSAPWTFAPGTEFPTNVVENPSLVKTGDHFYLLFAGNDWANSNYATGMADCGTSPLPASRCKLLAPTAKPYFAWSGNQFGYSALLPGNQRGAGGMSVNRSYKGTTSSVTWHSLVNLGPSRKISQGMLNQDVNYNWSVTP